MIRPPPSSTLFPSTPLFRSCAVSRGRARRALGRARAHLREIPLEVPLGLAQRVAAELLEQRDRKSTRLNSSHGYISYAVFCLKKKISDDSKRQELTYSQILR